VVVERQAGEKRENSLGRPGGRTQERIGLSNLTGSKHTHSDQTSADSQYVLFFAQLWLYSYSTYLLIIISRKSHTQGKLFYHKEPRRTSWTPFAERYHRYYCKNIRRSKNDQSVLTVVLHDVKRTVGVPIVGLVDAGVERAEDEGFPYSGDICAEIELCLHMPNFALIEDLQIDVSMD